MDLTDVRPVRSFGERRVVNNNYAQSDKSVGYELTAQLLPFKSTMKRQLKRRGYNVDFMPFNLIVPLYYNELVSKQNNSASNFEPVNCFEFAENPAFKISENASGKDLSFRNLNQFNIVANITDEIINVFRIAKLKKQSLGLGNFDTADAMTTDEKMQAAAAIKVEKDLENELIGTKPITFATIKKLFVIGLVIYLLWYMSK